jgi:hypothetical protein
VQKKTDKKTAKHENNTAWKTALVAPAPPEGGARLPLGAHAGNAGGKPGRSGRVPNAFREKCQDLSWDAISSMAEKILADDTHPYFMSMLKLLSEYGYSKPQQSIHFDGGLSISALAAAAYARAEALRIEQPAQPLINR